MKHLSSFGLILILLTTSFNCWSKINLKKTKKLDMPVDISEPLITAETSKNLQPKSIETGESSSSIMSKIADNSLSYFWDKSSIRNTAVGKAAEKVEKNLKAEMQFTDHSASKTQHKIMFKVLAMQALAKLEYKGWVQAAINYDARAAKTEAEISEKIFNKQDLVVSHEITREENKSQVALRWNW